MGWYRLPWDHQEMQLAVHELTVDRRILEPTKKRYPTFKDKRSWIEVVGGHNHDKIKPNTHWVGDPKLWKTIIQKFSHYCEGSEPHFRLSNKGSDKGMGNPQGIWSWRPAGFDYKTSRDWERDSKQKQSWRTQTNLARSKTQRRSSDLTGKLNQNYLLIVGRSLWRRESAGYGGLAAKSVRLLRLHGL